MRVVLVCIGFALGFALSLFVGPERLVVGANIDGRGEEREDAQVEALRLELAAVRRDLAAVKGERNAAPEVSELPATKAEEARKSPEALDLFLLDDLRRFVSSGALEQYFSGKREDLASFLVDGWIGVGRPELAYAVVTASAQQLPIDNLLRAAANALAEAGNHVLATEAHLRLLIENPGAALSYLREHAPDRALALLEGTTFDDKHQAVVRRGRLELLIALKRPEEALRLTDALLAEGRFPPVAWEFLVNAMPREIEARLLAQMQKEASPDMQRALDLHLVKALMQQGRNDDARRRIEARLLSGYDPALAEALTKAAPKEALSYLERQVRLRGEDAVIWAQYGDVLLDSGRKGEAYHAFERAIAIAPNEEATDRYLEADARRAAAFLLPFARARKDDEVFGDMADALWKRGDRNLAREYWEEALRLDPDDSEWTGKLARLKAQKDPLGDG